MPCQFGWLWGFHFLRELEKKIKVTKDTLKDLEEELESSHAEEYERMRTDSISFDERVRSDSLSYVHIWRREM